MHACQGMNAGMHMRAQMLPCRSKGFFCYRVDGGALSCAAAAGLVLYPVADPLLYSAWRPLQEVGGAAASRASRRGGGGAAASQQSSRHTCRSILEPARGPATGEGGCCWGLPACPPQSSPGLLQL